MRLVAAFDAGAWRRHAPIWLGLTAIVALSWLYLERMNAGMADMAGMSGMVGGMAHHAMAMPGAGLDALWLAFVMWGVMMVAMMVPTTVPAVSVFMALTSRRQAAESVSVTTAAYVAGYVATWFGYALLLAFAQWALTRAALLSPMATSVSATLSALILISAGIFQFTPLKDACLSKCRTPLGFFLAEWRDGKRGAFVLGLRHGSYCVACCWALMAVMFVVGAMSLAWMALLTAFVLVEKVAPVRWHISQVSGVFLVAWGAWVALAAWP